MKSAVPFTIKLIRWILIFRIILALLFLVFGLLIVFIQPETGILVDLAHVLFVKYTPGNTQMTLPVLLNSFAGSMLLPFMIIIFELLFLRMPSAAGFWVVLGIDFLFSLSGFGLPVLQLAILVISLFPHSRAHLLKRGNATVKQSTPTK